MCNWVNYGKDQIGNIYTCKLKDWFNTSLSIRICDTGKNQVNYMFNIFLKKTILLICS